MLEIRHPLYQEDLHNASALIDESGLTGKILIIGATGLVGSFLTDTLAYYNRNIQNRFDVYAMGRSRKRLKERFSYLSSEEIWLWEHDINSPLETDIEFDYIFHLASNADPGTYSEYPMETITTNVLGSINVLQYVKKHLRTRVLFTSSMEVYGENSGDALQESDYGLIDYNNIRAGYPESKRVAELLYRSAVKQYGIFIHIARLGYIYGPTMTKYDNKVVAQFIRAAVNGQEIVLKSAGRQRRTYCYVSDAVTGMVKVLMKGRVGEVYNVADVNSLVTIKQLGDIIAKQAGTKLIIEYNSEQSILPDRREDKVLDCGKLEGLGWAARVGIEAGIARSLRINMPIKMDN